MLLLACLVVLGSLRLGGQVASDVSYQRLLNAAKEPQNWLSYSGTYFSQRYSLLDQINLSNVKDPQHPEVVCGAEPALCDYTFTSVTDISNFTVTFVSQQTAVQGLSPGLVHTANQNGLLN